MAKSNFDIISLPGFEGDTIVALNYELTSLRKLLKDVEPKLKIECKESEQAFHAAMGALHGMVDSGLGHMSHSTAVVAQKIE